MKGSGKIRRRTWEVLEAGAEGDTLSRTIDVMIMALVFLNVVTVVLDSVESIRHDYHDLFLGFEKMSVFAVSAEFLLRIWSVASASEGRYAQDQSPTASASATWPRRWPSSTSWPSRPSTCPPSSPSTCGSCACSASSS